MVFYCLDTESDKWNIEYAIYQKKTYAYQILKPKLFTIVKYDDNCNELDFHLFKRDNMLQLLITYLKDEFLELKNILRIYCHNLDFDIKFLISILTYNHFKLKPIRKNRLLSLKVFSTSIINGKNKNTYFFDFRDSYALLPLSIRELGVIINLPKLDFDLNNDVDENMIEYCKRDNDIIAKSLKVLIELFKQFGYSTSISELPLTIPSLSMKLFKEQNKKLEFIKELESGKTITKNRIFDISPQLNQYFRQFYYGGKTECYNFNIFFNCAYYDKNSLYPFTMLKNKYPIPPYLKVKSSNEEDINEFTFALLCIIDESNELYPLIPERDENGTVFFSANSHKLHLLQIEEYYYLKKRNCIKQIIDIWYCDQFCNTFDYFAQIYEIRLQFQKENNKLEKLCKLPPNSTSGKFAQDIDTDEREILPLSLKNTDELFKLMLENKIQNINIESKSYEFITKKEDKVQIDNINLIFAIRTTALSRLNITQDQHNLQNNNVIFSYTDTDSIVANENKILNLGKELGQMKKEKEFERFLCLSPKEYLYEEKIDEIDGMSIFVESNKIKGIKPNSDFNKYLKDGITDIRPTKIFESWKRNIPMNSAITIKKMKNTFFKKRLILSDLSTKPLHNIKHARIIEKHNRNLILKQIKKWNDFNIKNRK